MSVKERKILRVKKKDGREKRQKRVILNNRI